MRFSLQRVRTMPAQLEPGILYVSEEFETAAHLCACGCGSKIRTPLAPTEWTFVDDPAGPTLHPSIGNWQRACRSHYSIIRGGAVWSTQWSAEEVIAGRRGEEQRRQQYYYRLYRDGPLARLWRWISGVFR